MTAFVINHLWQSSVFGALAGLLAFALRRHPARVRFWIWMTASLKFVVPFALLAALGSHSPWRLGSPPAQPHALSVLAQPFPLATTVFTESRPGPLVPVPTDPRPLIVLALWLSGFLCVVGCWIMRWHRIFQAIRSATPATVRLAGFSTPVLLTDTAIEPGVFGIIRPVLLLPQDIAKRLSNVHLQSVAAHERCHIQRRDNLWSLLHMLVEAVFWFHPLVWWIGGRLLAERERACDEAVLQDGADEEIYAEGILQVCRYYTGMPVACVSGIAGSDLTNRIAAIMNYNFAGRLSRTLSLGLACLALAIATVPVFVGMMDAPILRAQSVSSAVLRFEVAAIRPAEQDEERGFDTEKGRFLAHNVTLKQLVARAYDSDIGLISGGPKWLDSDRYDINAKIPEAVAQPTADQGREMLRGLLTDRFQLVIHRKPGLVAGYALVVGKSGPKMEHADPDVKGTKIRFTRDNKVVAENVTMEEFAKDLNRIVGKLVVDHTGLSGYFKFELDWMPDRPQSSTEPSSDDRPSIFTALQEGLGLRLESATVPVSEIVVDRAEKPTPN